MQDELRIELVDGMHFRSSSASAVSRSFRQIKSVYMLKFRTLPGCDKTCARSTHPSTHARAHTRTRTRANARIHNIMHRQLDMRWKVYVSETPRFLHKYAHTPTRLRKNRQQVIEIDERRRHGGKANASS